MNLKRIFFMTLVILLGSFAIFTFVFQKSAKGTTPATLNLMTFNYAYNMYGSTWDQAIADYIVAQNLDAVVFPEVNCDRIDKIVKRLVGRYPIDNNHRDRYYKCITFGNCGGQAVFSKYGFQDYNFQSFNGCTDCTNFSPVIQVVSINHPSGKIWLIANHPGIKPYGVNGCRNTINRRVVELIRTKPANYFPNYQPGQPVFAMGDFNESPVEQNIRDILVTHQTVCPYGQPTCGTTVKGSCTNGIRCSIDHIFYPRDASWQLQSGYVVRDGAAITGASDHYAVVGKFIYQQGPTPTPCSPPAPQNLSPSGNTLSGQHAFTWNSVPGATRYALRIDDRANSWTGSCTNVNPRDICLDNLTTNSYNYTVQAGHTYRWWVHGINSCGWSNESSASITGVAPTPTPTSTPRPTSTPTPRPTPTPSPTPTPTPIPGDFNQDGRVNILDLRYVFSNFTNIFDYNLVVKNFADF